MRHPSSQLQKSSERVSIRCVYVWFNAKQRATVWAALLSVLRAKRRRRRFMWPTHSCHLSFLSVSTLFLHFRIQFLSSCCMFYQYIHTDTLLGKICHTVTLHQTWDMVRADMCCWPVNAGMCCQPKRCVSHMSSPSHSHPDQYIIVFNGSSSGSLNWETPVLSLNSSPKKRERETSATQVSSRKRDAGLHSFRSW